MTKRMQLSDLQECLINFETEKLEGCSVVYFNDTLADGKSSETILDAYSYIVRSDSMPSRDQSSVKTFMAERYGGDGILSNGGGGRCGFDGLWQLKGLGPNQLVGKDVDADHGDGNLSLETAIYESIWSEIINVTLPFGAIRTVAVLDTRRMYEERGILTPRGLLVRQSVVRPAHFIRAIYFKEQQFDRLSEDAQRVKTAIAKLIDFLPGAGIASTASSMSERLEFGLLELATRFAEQFAAAKAKHIIHYNVSASNLSLDGAWLDLSGTRLFTKLIEGYRVDINRFNTEHFPVVESLQSLCYYLSKYSVITIGESTHILEKTIKHFTQAYKKQLDLYQVAQAGFPLWILRALAESAEFINFSSSLNKVLALDDFTANAITLEGGWTGYERWTAQLFNELLSSRINTTVENLSWLSTDTTDISQLLSRYNQLFDLTSQVSKKQHINLQNLYRCMLINTTRLNRSHSLLHDIKGEIERIGSSEQTDKKSAYKTLTEQATLTATFNLANEQGRCVPFWLNNTLSIWFDPTSGMFTLQAVVSRSLSIDALVELREHQIDVNTALGFYGRAWSSLNEKKF